MKRRWILWGLGVAAAAGAAWTIAASAGGAVALQAATATPGQLIVPTVSPSPPGGQPPTATFTNTPPGPAFVEVENEINVRSGPGIDYSEIGKIFPGERYVIIGRHEFYPWIKIEYPSAPGRAGWVYQDIVSITGNTDNVRVLTQEEAEQRDEAGLATLAAQQTAEVLIATPGAAQTATAIAEILEPATTPTLEAQESERLPTFTPPSGPILQPTFQPSAFQSPRMDQIPPAIPILGLMALGLVLLVVSFIRRG
jgi:SH3-like domain-containing protein